MPCMFEVLVVDYTQGVVLCMSAWEVHKWVVWEVDCKFVVWVVDYCILVVWVVDCTLVVWVLACMFPWVDYKLVWSAWVEYKWASWVEYK